MSSTLSGKKLQFRNPLLWATAAEKHPPSVSQVVGAARKPTEGCGIRLEDFRRSNRLSAAKIDALLRKWLGLLPHPFTAADRKAGYRYDISMLQAEFSTTQVLDLPVHGRLFLEQVIARILISAVLRRCSSSSIAGYRATRRGAPVITTAAVAHMWRPTARADPATLPVAVPHCSPTIGRPMLAGDGGPVGAGD
jgi:hypothetical protein